MKHASPALAPGALAGAERLLHVSPRAETCTDHMLEDLPDLLLPGDLLVVNDAATLPASLAGTTGRQEPLEVRLAGEEPDGTWRVILFGSGDWRTPTESRPPPPVLDVGDSLRLGPGLGARITRISELSPRLAWLRFDPPRDVVWTTLYQRGRPIQYAYEQRPLSLERVQTPYAGPPWASEMPSAGRALRLPLLARARARGVALGWLTHAAGLSSTGDPVLDAALPLPERYQIPSATVAAIEATRERAGRVVAVGTTVVRALEGSARSNDGAVVSGPGITDLRIGPGFVPRVVSGLLSGIHARDSSHFELLAAFLPSPLDLLYTLHAAAGGYRPHEFGDSTLILD